MSPSGHQSNRSIVETGDKPPQVPAFSAAGEGYSADTPGQLGVTQGTSYKTMSSPGPDTVHFSWPEGTYQVLRDSELRVNSATEIGSAKTVSGPLVVIDGGERVEGSSGWYKDPLGRFDVQLKRGRNGRPRLVVGYSADYGTGDNFDLPSAAAFRSRWLETQGALEAAGIVVAAEDGRVERLDVAENVEVPRSAEGYIEPLRRYVDVDARLLPVNDSKHATTAWWKNGARQLVIYVKGDCLRVEWRAMGIASVARTFSAGSLVALLDDVDSVVGRARELTEGVLPLLDVPASAGGYEALFRAADPDSNACVSRVMLALACGGLPEGEADAVIRACRKVKGNRAALRLQRDFADSDVIRAALDEERRRELVLYNEFRTFALAA